jgi:hypothetical protein
MTGAIRLADHVPPVARGTGEPRLTTEPMFRLLVQSGVSPIPTDYAEAAALIDNLPPSPKQVEVLP